MSDQYPSTPSRDRDADFGPSRHHDDEISLYDLWDVLVRRFPVMLGVGAVVALAGLAYALTQPVTYDYRTGIDLPRVYHQEDGMRLVVSADAAIARLEDVIIPAQRGELFGDEEGGPRVRVVERGGEHSIMLESSSTRERRDRVERIHEAVAEDLSGQFEGRYEQWVTSMVRPHENRVAMLEEQLSMLEEQLSNLSGRLDGADGVSSLVIAQQMGDLRREMGELRRDRVEASSVMEIIQNTSHGTELAFLSSESETPTGAGRSLIVALSVVLGGMLGLFAGFFWEFVSNARARQA
ncbi:Wzz/FepE/Etk N-terminal domain-containing protein [Aquisalimonas asiatica]|uniref:Uncharacterized protein involved in exopolysaccharide biosynthesis n=1 Tax=Aquisalimonas asiatica TaxID=406100 RepID=A0A1H8SP53_9GAMM|nr:Wzz/FepE/Etk N-terminal domain-containing protein [Aquisalimonas asiatica]SEO80502.1 Uncharacterized protein involved in exopolysaccharide biosynthesis [Aquisalimonas asiatica]